MSVNLSVSVQITGKDDRSAENSQLKNVLAISPAILAELLDGTGLNQIDFLWDDRRSLAATSEELDLVGGLTDKFGNAFNVAKLKAVIIRNRETEAGKTLKIGGATNGVLIFDSATDIHTIHPGGFAVLVNPSLAGWAVTSSTADKLKLDAGANTVAFDIVLAGVKA